MPVVFVITLFLSAGLLFWVEPMIAKMLLPLLGGAPSVWNTCMVFFQAALLGGYAYAHFVSTRLKVSRQIAVHFVVLAFGTLALPLGISERLVQSLSPTTNPFVWLLSALTLVAGLPFFAMAGTGPLLQRWFSHTDHVRAGDPYFLYSSSNFGSLIALLAYPVLLEPGLRSRTQSRIWTIGYLVEVLLILVCAGLVWRSWRKLGTARPAGQQVFTRSDGPSRPPVDGETKANIRAASDHPVEDIHTRTRLRWIVLAFVPSSLMLGATSYLATDIASIPLLWVVPLSIYLLSFILVFARRQVFPARWLRWLLPVAALGVVFPILSRATHPIWLLISLHLLFLFLAAMLCHGRLAAERPPTVRLTEFYFWISLGGALGGVFNALVAPNLFNRVIEYPVVIVLVCLLRPPRAGLKTKSVSRPLDVTLPILLGIFTAALAILVPIAGLKSVNLRNAVIIGLPAILCFTFVDRPARFGLGLAAIYAGGWFYLGPQGKTLLVERNFFGVSRVTLGATGTFRYFVHGNTLHGEQFVDSRRACEPLAYYHRNGPLGQVFTMYNERPASRNVAVVGLGTGATACYAEPGQQWTFYEIDPAVVRIAENTNYFTYLRVCAKTAVQIVIGDARLRLREAPSRHYGLIVLDAFSSDAIPVHLLTREAVDLYLSKLADGGSLVFHISNRYLDLEPVLADLARSAGLVCRQWDDCNLSTAEVEDGKEESHWVIVARRQSDLGYLLRKLQWQPLEGRSPPQVWTDDYSNLIGVFKWQ